MPYPKSPDFTGSEACKHAQSSRKVLLLNIICSAVHCHKVGENAEKKQPAVRQLSTT